MFDFSREKNEEIQSFHDLDLVEIPIEGVAAYWLSLKKVQKGKLNARLIQKEAEYTSEPYIQYLLQLLLSQFPEEKLDRYAGIKKESLSRDLQRKLTLISIGLLGMSAQENPQQVLVRIISKFSISPIEEKNIFQTAQGLLQATGKGQKVADVDHRLQIDHLVSNLIFYCMLCRRQGKEACQPFMECIRSFYFREGLQLILDGFEQEFIKYRLNLQKNEILHETRRKMDLSREMFLGLKNNCSYEDLFRIANAFLL
ncbi:MAG: hypothetical protein ACQEQX_01545 [Thermodesulfobacteriota bacterium]